MMQTKTGHRIVIIGPAGASTTQGGLREPPSRQRVTPRRIVVIKDGQLVGGKAGR
jgi:hypothetical protein